MRSAMIRCFYFVLILLVAGPLFAQDKRPRDPLFDPVLDPIGETLTVAKASYKDEVSKATKVLLDAIDARVKRVENSSTMKMEAQLELLKELAAEREAFVGDSKKLPAQRTLKSAVKKFERQLRESRSTLVDAFEDAAEAYRKPPKKNFEAAAKTIEDRDAFLKEIGAETKKKGKGKEEKGSKGKESFSKEAKKLAFTPAFDADNWVVSASRFVEVKNDRLIIHSARQKNIVFTKKFDYLHPDVTIELAAAKGTEAFLFLNGQFKDGDWNSISGVTSKIHFANGKINAGGQRTGFRENSRKREQGIFEVGEDFKIHIYVHQHPADADNKLVKSWVNGKMTGNLSYSFSSTNEEGTVGFLVLKGALSIKSFKLSER